MNYKDWYEKSFKEWRESIKDPQKNIYNKAGEENRNQNVFIYDGIANPELWFNQEKRPLFILKEAYGGDKDWDEVKWFLTKGTPESGNKEGKIKNATWRRIAKWAAYIFLDDEEFDKTPMWENKSLQKIALINIKKYGGTSISKDGDLEQHAIEYAKELFNQIKTIRPTLIVCGYTGWLLDIVWENNQMEPIRGRNHDSRVYDVNGLDGPVRMIDFWHPSARCTKIDLDKAFQNDLKIALSNNPLPKTVELENVNKETI